MFFFSSGIMEQHLTKKTIHTDHYEIYLPGKLYHKETQAVGVSEVSLKPFCPSSTTFPALHIQGLAEMKTEV